MEGHRCYQVDITVPHFSEGMLVYVGLKGAVDMRDVAEVD